MAHLQLKAQAQQSQPALFSPSVARAAASTAKDWAYVDGWLRDKFGGRPPPLERNPDTLKALLALAAANEAADEERETLARIEEAALHEARQAEAATARARQQQQQQQQQRAQEQDHKTTENTSAPAPAPTDGAALADALLAALESSLSEPGLAALDALSETAVALSDPTPTASSLSSRFASLQAEAAGVSATAARVDLLQRYLARQSAHIEALLAELRDPGLPFAAVSDASAGWKTDGKGADSNDYDDDKRNKENENDNGDKQPFPDLSTSNAHHRSLNARLSALLPTLRSQASELEALVSGLPSTLVSDVLRDEAGYSGLLARKKKLDEQVRAFAGLPPDLDAARLELESLRDTLDEMTARRDGDFERLVERESPVKSRKGR